MTREQILDKVIRENLQNISILEKEGICSLGQIKSEHWSEAFSSKLYVDEETMEGPASGEDIEAGFQLFQAIVYCPLPIIKLFRFIDQLFSNESTRTIIQTIVNLFHSEVLEDASSFILAREFYLVLASTLDLQYGNVLLAVSTNSQLQTVLDNGWPFFTNYTHLVKTCLKYSDCSGIQNIIQTLGNLLGKHL